MAEAALAMIRINFGRIVALLSTLSREAAAFQA